MREHLSAYAYPRQIEFVPDLPKTLTGKIRRIELRQARAGAGERHRLSTCEELVSCHVGCLRSAPALV